MYKFPGQGDHKFFVWRTLPYGYTRAPYIARALMKPLVAKWRALGICTVVFYDDGMAVGDDKILLLRNSLQMQCDLIRAGLIPGVNKCVWMPVQQVDWNGFCFNLKESCISILDKRISSTLSSIDDIKKSWPKITFRDLSRTIGKIVSMQPVFQGITQIRTKMLQTFLAIRGYKNLSWDDIISADFAPLFTKAYQELGFWQTFLLTKNFRAIKLKKVDWIVWTDASDYAIAGFGAKLLSPSINKPITADNLMLVDGKIQKAGHHRVSLQVDEIPWAYKRFVEVRDAFDLDPQNISMTAITHRNLENHERIMSSTERELLAALHFLNSMLRHTTGQTLTLHMDSQNAVNILTSGSNKPRLNDYAVLYSQICLANNITVTPVWIPRTLNNIADFLSKTVDYDDFSITDDFFQEVCKDFGMLPTFDRFATDKNNKTVKFNSPYYCPFSSGVDAFNYDWSLTELIGYFAQYV